MYFITTFEKIPSEEMGSIGRSRCFGYFTTLWESHNAIVNNTLDIHEGIYFYGVIEYIEQGIHQIASERWFYKYNEELDEFEIINEPEELKHIVNFSIG